MTDRSKTVDLVSPIEPRDLKNFLKYCSDDNRVIKSIFEDHNIRFTQPAALNDPLEFNPIIRFGEGSGKYTNYLFDGILFPSEEMRIRHQLIERQLSKYPRPMGVDTYSDGDKWIARYYETQKGKRSR